MPRKNSKKKKRKDGLVEIKRNCGTDHLGRQIRKSFYGKTKKEAEEKYIQFMMAGSDPTPAKKYSFVDWMDRWLADYKEPNISDQTYQRTYLPIRRELAKKFPRRQLQSFQPVEWQHYFNAAAFRSGSYLNKRKMFLTGLFQAAVDNDLIDKSPMRGVIVPNGAPAKEKRAYTNDQYKKVLAFAQSDPDGLGPFIMLKYGLRRSELLGLMWKDIDFTEKTLHIERAVRMDHGIAELGPTKTKRSNRTLPLDDDFIEHLKMVPRSSIYVMGAFGDGNKPRNPDTWVRERFGAYCARLTDALPDIPVLSPHELRHTFGSILYNAGVDIVTISRMMGHSKIDVTVNTYVHSDVEDLRNNLLKIAN